MKKIKTLILIMLLLLPIDMYAYSDYIVVGGETIGIEVHSKGIYVVGFYSVDGKNIAEDAGFLVGDVIKSIDKKEVSDISSLNQILSSNKKYSFSVLRGNKLIDIDFQLKEENDVLKTGLYVKDQIYGIGTLSYIDPNTKVFGSLGHEILESSSFSKFDIENGTIYKAEVSSIKKSSNGITGEKNANIDKDTVYGDINTNEVEGIFGIYTNDIDSDNLIEVGKKEDIRKGEAIIRTVVKDEVIEDFNINILSVDDTNTTKNILFEITDQKLINKTGGIVQGMSGSPIIQNNKIIGVVNYVIVDEAKKGYGIFITKMLEEGDKIIS